MQLIVVDTNVPVAALRSRRGASFAMLQTIGDRWTPLISVSLILEYEAAMLRAAQQIGVPSQAADALVDAFCYYGLETPIYFRLRTALPDPADEFLIDLAVAGNADAIVTHNIRHLAPAVEFGIPVITPRAFLARIGMGDEQ